MTTADTPVEITLRPEGQLDWGVADLWRYRDLLGLLVRRDFVAKYRQTILGPAWFLLPPLLTTIIFTIIFGRIARLPTDGLPPLLFYLCGQLGWSYFSQSLTTSSSTFVTNASLFSKVYFPRLIVPLSALISGLAAFALQLAMFFAFLVYYRFFAGATELSLGPSVLLLPVVVLHTAALTLGAGLILSALTAKYRDLTHAIGLLAQLWMYATPVIYPLSMFPPAWRWVAALNPMTPVLELYRLILLGSGTVVPAHLAWSVSVTLTLLAAGLLLFGKTEKTAVDVV